MKNTFCSSQRSGRIYPLARHSKTTCTLILGILASPTIVLAAEAAPSQNGLGALGISLGALIFQLVNFGLLFFVLARFVYPPLVKLFDDRRKRIEKALEDAEVTAKLRSEMEHERETVLSEAKAQAGKIVSDATAEAQNRSRAILIEADERSKAIVARAVADTQSRVAKLRDELRNDLHDLVAAATAKVLSGVIDSKVDARLIDKAIKEVQK